MISSIANLVYKLPHELPNDLRLRTLGYIRKISNLSRDTAQCPVSLTEIKLWQQKSKSTQKQISNFSFPVQFYQIYLFCPNNLPRMVGVKIDTNLNLQYYVNDLSIKLNRGNALLFEMRKYGSLKILRSIYFAIFESYLSYCCLVWDQNRSTIQRVVILQ